MRLLLHIILSSDIMGGTESKSRRRAVVQEGGPMAARRMLGVGFIGSGFITRFHIKSWVGVRDADILGIWSPNPTHREEAASMARALRVGNARAFSSIEEMVAAPEIDCIWI